MEQRIENLTQIREETKASLEVIVKIMKKKTIENKVSLKEGQKV